MELNMSSRVGFFRRTATWMREKAKKKDAQAVPLNDQSKIIIEALWT